MQSPHLASHLVAGLNARSKWKDRDFEEAFRLADDAARQAAEAGDDEAWWDMRYLQAECLRDQGLIEEYLDLAIDLKEHPLTAASPELGAKAGTMLAVAYQGLGRLQEAAETADEAANLAAWNPDLLYVRILAQRALIAALAESRLLDEAWQECLVLETLLTDDVDEDTAGKGYWVIGNVAFLADRVVDGGRYHDLASERLSPSKDVDLWARFNRASAEMRLQAKVSDAATLRCIERAELATDIVGGSERDHLEMSLVRAHWYFLSGDLHQATAILGPLCERSSILATQTAAEAHFLLARSLTESGRFEDALENFDQAAALFEQANLPERSAAVREHLRLENERRGQPHGG
ncbi:tetratricopeptide repeat protein [Paenarthrobacter ilicis]|uniref:Tetratricopeptide (TPR) repeat protein n=1 Tax=Paenarthrobacter ilicis TaxID=43665 RepID=A0ABX0TEQ4_9MICC|nr:tetratricopeptide repeat protein [Paenarthrobacter ilicis]MBM7794215.1 tetratricopeptide (TPR) repeat protein [Paenarthrobacter ilicis]NIJ00395.1 tetratricopeptide (TPR) repeat protein [Paenarthrobacter ilicis]